MSDERPTAFDRRAASMTSRRNLPHWRQGRAVYFVTFRLADSLPAERLAELNRLRLGRAFKDTGWKPVLRSTGF